MAISRALVIFPSLLWAVVPLQTSCSTGSGTGVRNERALSEDIFGSPAPIVVPSSGVSGNFDPSDFPDPLVACDGSSGSGRAGIIDDFEDGDGAIRSGDGRRGSWFAYGDGSGGEQTPNGADVQGSESDRSAGGLALHVHGSGYSDWGSGIGFPVSLESEGGRRCLYDATAYDGVSFWAKGDAQLDVLWITPAVIPREEAGRCDGFIGGCYDSHSMVVSLDEEWSEYQVQFADMDQHGWGQDVGPLEPRELVSLQFQVPAGADYEFWLDDLRFTGPDAHLDDFEPEDATLDAGMDAGDVDGGPQ
jgi:hypothetical protein